MGGLNPNSGSNLLSLGATNVDYRGISLFGIPIYYKAREFQNARLCKSRDGDYERKEYRTGAKFPWFSRLKLCKKESSSETKRSNVFSAKVETWKYHSKSMLCPACNEETTPITFSKHNKFTSSRLGAMCLLGCWPFCLIPLMTIRDKRAKIVCPVCGYDYSRSKSKGNNGEEQLSLGSKYSDGEWPYYRTHCRLQMQPEYQEPQVGDATPVNSSIRAEVSDTEMPTVPAAFSRGRAAHQQSRLNLSHEYTLCRNQLPADHRYRIYAKESEPDYAYESGLDPRYYLRTKHNTCCRRGGDQPVSSNLPESTDSIDSPGDVARSKDRAARRTNRSP
ncbi:hypothetical protein KM043_016592 [Ampulex compressa]|nr:hypothetical protein KM043_016592 [Ampulex compressa]